MTMRINRDADYATINVFVDASFAVHHTMRSHTGAIIAMGKFTQFWKSSKQHLNTKSSTEAELKQYLKSYLRRWLQLDLCLIS